MISQSNVEHIARLARIALSPEEVERYGTELGKILEFVAVLEKADTAKVEPLTGGTVIENALRDDVGQETGDRKQETVLADAAALVAAAPAARDGYIAVKAVFERS